MWNDETLEGLRSLAESTAQSSEEERRLHWEHGLMDRVVSCWKDVLLRFERNEMNEKKAFLDLVDLARLTRNLTAVDFDHIESSLVQDLVQVSHQYWTILRQLEFRHCFHRSDVQRLIAALIQTMFNLRRLDTEGARRSFTQQRNFALVKLCLTSKTDSIVLSIVKLLSWYTSNESIVQLLNTDAGFWSTFTFVYDRHWLCVNAPKDEAVSHVLDAITEIKPLEDPQTSAHILDDMTDIIHQLASAETFDLERLFASQRGQTVISTPQLILLQLFDADIHASPEACRPKIYHFLLQLLTEQSHQILALFELLIKDQPIDSQALILYMQSHKLLCEMCRRGLEIEAYNQDAIATIALSSLVKSLIDILRLAHQISPPVRQDFASRGISQAQQSHKASKTSKAALEPIGSMKRTIVPLLGMLANERPILQRAIVDHGGLEIILNLTTLDEREPYIREHAILAVRLITKDHQHAQNRLASITSRPIGTLDEDGMLHDLK